MKILKSTIAIILTIIIASTCAAIAGAAAEQTAKSVTVTQNKTKTIKVKQKKNSRCSYYGKLTKNGKKYVKVKYQGYKGGKAVFSVKGIKATDKKPVTVKLIRKSKKTGKITTIKTLKVTVKLIRKDKKTDKKTTIKTLKETDEEKAQVNPPQTETPSEPCDETDNNNTALTMKYSTHGRASVLFPETITSNLSSCDGADLDNLTFETDPEYIEYNKNSAYPFTAKKTGETSITVLDGDKMLATVNVKIENGTMADVFANNLGGEVDTDFLNWGNYLYLSEEDMDCFNIPGKINSAVLNNDLKGTSFSKDEYTITYRNDSEYITVDKDGLVYPTSKAPEVATVKVEYTITFSDDSQYTGDIIINIC